MNASQRRVARRRAPPVLRLPKGLWYSGDVLTFACRSCGEHTEWPAGPEDFDINEHANMCGGSPRCLP
jgi:hypothetical protein